MLNDLRNIKNRIGANTPSTPERVGLSPPHFPATRSLNIRSSLLSLNAEDDDLPRGGAPADVRVPQDQGEDTRRRMPGGGWGGRR